MAGTIAGAIGAVDQSRHRINAALLIALIALIALTPRDVRSVVAPTVGA